MSVRHRLGPDFSALLSAALVSNLGDGLRITALPLLATTLTTSPLLIGGITAAQFLPWTTFAPIGGVIVDRSDRRRLIMTTQGWRAVVMAMLAVAVVMDAVQIWHLFVVAYVITVGEILVDPSMVATVPKLVAPADLDRANSRLSTVEIVTNEFVGGPIGAATFTLVPWLPFALDGLSYAGSILLFGRLPPNRAEPTGERPSLRDELSAGLRWIAKHPFLRSLTTAFAVFHLGTAGGFSLLVLVVTDLLDAPDVVFGVVLAASAAGASLSALLAAALTDRYSRRSVMTAGATVIAVSVVATGLATQVWHVVVAWTLYGAAGGVLLSIGRGFVQRHTPNELLGRAAIANRMITRTSFVVGALVAGSVGSLISVRWSYFIAGLLHLMGATLLWWAFRHEPTDNAVNAEAASS